MKNKSKLTLEELQVESFVTEGEDLNAQTVKGGDSAFVCITVSYIVSTMIVNSVLLSAQCLYVYIFAKREQQECLVILTQILVCRSALHHTLEIQLVIELVLRSALMVILLRIAQICLEWHRFAQNGIASYKIA